MKSRLFRHNIVNSVLCSLMAAAYMMFIPFSASAAKWSVPKENISYNIMYKWGIINKKAGTVTISTSVPDSGRNFHSRLTGATAPWADRFYKVRDTLRGTIDHTTFLPIRYEKITSEGGHNEHDSLEFFRSGNTTKANAVHRKKGKKDKAFSEEKKLLEAEGLTVDMLSSFYYMRQINYSAMKKGESVRLNVFSGKRKEILEIHYQGVVPLRIDDKIYSTYHITFTFTIGSGKKSSDNMDAWISTAPGRIPLQLEGKLPVGKVRALYNGPMPKS